jgi:nitrite reductase/ring-hydroxylating ferredoxin subunit
MGEVTLGRASDIAENRAQGFHAPGGRLFVVRRAGALFAYWDACPHYGDTPMAWRAGEYLNAARDRIVCASHGAEFDIETGLCTKGAALGKCLTRAPVWTNAHGELVLSAPNHSQERS